MRLLRAHKKNSLVVLCLILASFLFLRKKLSVIPTKTAQIGDVVVSVSANETVKADREVDLHFQTTGKLVALPYKEGETVKKGDTITQLDTYTLQRQLVEALRYE